MKMTKEKIDFIMRDMKKHPYLYHSLSTRDKFRYQHGKIYTDEEFEAKSDRILHAPMPGDDETKKKRLALFQKTENQGRK